jgi:hypothetical protein
MTIGRRVWLLMPVMLGLAGCRADGTGSLSLHPRPALAPTSFDLDEFVADHNRNATRIKSLEARPSIGVAMEKRHQFHVDGRLALERPRNFKLELAHYGVTKADIGSNDDEFWYWVVNKQEPYVYWCRYAEVESSELAVTFQPDWIIEALGLKPITPEEAATVQVRRGEEAGTSVLTFPTVRNQGEPYSREMIVSNKDRTIKKLRLFSEAQKPRVLIAEAMPGNYQAYSEGSTLPQRLKLEWKREQLALDVSLKEVKLNQFDHARSAELFTEPDMEGYQRKNLADLSRGARQDRRTTRQTMPPPETRNGVELGRPSPMTDEEDTPGGSLGSRSSAPFPTLDDVVGAPTPRPPSAGPVQPARFSSAPDATGSIER